MRRVGGNEKEKKRKGEQKNREEKRGRREEAGRGEACRGEGEKYWNLGASIVSC